MCGKAWAYFQFGFCCQRRPINWTLLLFSRSDSHSLSPVLPPCLGGQESFVRAKNWVKELQRQASPNIVIALAGNKADLANKRALDFQVGVLPTCRRRHSQTHISSFGSFLPCERRSLCLFPCAGCTVIRRRQQLTFHGDVCQNLHERERDLHGHR